MASDISVANLITYFRNTWDISIASAPNGIISTLNKNPKSLLTIHRKTPLQTWIAANVKQIDEIFEFTLSHPTEAAIDLLNKLSLAYPGTPGSTSFDDRTCTLSNWTTTGTVTVVDGKLTFAATSTAQSTPAMTITDATNQRINVTWISQSMASGIVTIGIYQSTTLKGYLRLTPGSSTAMAVLNTGGSVITTFTKAADHIISIRNMNFTTGTADLYIDDTLTVTGFSLFTDTLTTLSSIKISTNNETGVVLDNIWVCGGAGIDLNLVPVSVSDPVWLGIDTAGNNVWTLLFKATRWE